MASAALALVALAGCGVKNDPIAPTTGQVPPAADAGPAPQADQVVADPLFEPAREEDEIFARRNPAALTSSDDTIDAAPVSRNPGAADDGFFLDPLLN